MKNCVSVLLPFHRADEYLSSAIKSVSRSKDVQVQLILIDDRKIKVNDNYSKISKIWTGGIGYASALNAAKNLVECEYTALMNSDDLISEDRLKLQCKSIQENKCDISVSRLLKINAKGMPIFALGGSPKIENPSLLNFLVGSHLANASWMARSDFWGRNVNFRDIQLGSDWVLGQELIRKFKFHQLESRLYYYRTHKSQITKIYPFLPGAIGPIWRDINLNITGIDIPDSFGLNLAFPNQFKLNKSEITNEAIYSFESWSKMILEKVNNDEISTVRTRLAYLSFELWKNARKTNLVTPYLTELLEIYFKSKSNSILNASVKKNVE